MDHLVIDIETKQLASDVGGWHNKHMLDLSVAVVYVVACDDFSVYFGPQDISRLQDRLLRADRISGFNILNFDMPVIFKTPQTPKEIFFKVDDVFRRILIARGVNPDAPSSFRGWGLDPITLSMFRKGKIADGTDAPVMYNEGRIGDLISYCLSDVKLERDLTLFIDKYGWMRNGGQVVDVPKWTPVIPPVSAFVNANAKAA